MCIIGCDLDSTLVELGDAICSKISKELNSNITAEDIMDWEWECFPEDYRRRAYDLYADADFMCSLKPIIGAQEKIDKWKSEGKKVLIITARTLSIEDETKEMVRALFPNVDGTFVTAGTDLKKDVMANEKLDVWVDDSSKGVMLSMSLGIKTYLISHNATKYNWGVRNFKGLNVVPTVADIEL